jgi:PAS domain S-box-containing protein
MAAGIFILSNRRFRPAIVVGVIVGTVAANLMSDRHIWTALLKGFCNAGEAGLVAWLIERWLGRPFAFDDLRRVLGFVAAACFGAAASALGGAATMTLFHIAAPYWDVWRAWFLSDGVGIVMAAPLVIGLGQVWHKLPSRAESIEAAGVLTVLALIISYAVTHPTGSWLSFDPDAVVLPLLLWLVARCKPVFGIVGAFIVSLTVIYATIFGIGHFGDAAVPIADRVSGAQMVIVMVTLYTLTLAALFAQRKDAEERLAKKSVALTRLHDASSHLWRKRDLRKVLDEILAGAIELLDADMGHIQILDPERGVLEIAAHRGTSQELLNLISEMSTADSSACGRALQSGKRIVIEDVEVDTRYEPFRSAARLAGYRAVQATPIMSSVERPLGILCTHFRSPHPLNDEDLRLLDLYVRLAADIIERHQADDALCKSEERLRLAQLKTGIGLWDWDLHTSKVTWTPELEAIFGLEPGTVKTYADFRSRVHPDDIERVEAERDAAIRRREPFNLEFRIIRSDTEIRWILAMGGAFYDEVTGAPTRILGNNLDITERKLAELGLSERNTQLGLASKTARVGSFAIDIPTGLVNLSPGCASILGLPESTAEFSRENARRLVHPEDLAQLDTPRNNAFLKKQGEFIAQFRIIRANDGEVRWIEARSMILYDQAGQPSRLISVIIDFTDRKRVEEQQRVLLGELDHRVKNSLATVSAVVSHTLSASSSMADFATALDGRVQSMARTQELLSASGWQGISVAELVRRELAPYATTGNTEINGSDVILKAEAGQALAMVLHELATNAAKYGALSTPNGRVVIRWVQHPNGHARSHLVLEWREVGGPSVVAPQRSGFGMHTIRDLVTYEFAGTVDLTFAPEGVRCRVELPANWLSANGKSVSKHHAHPFCEADEF